MTKFPALSAQLSPARTARLELHLLHSLPPSNINRDDAGAPKDAVFGDVRRSRVSSQAFKAAMRRFQAESGLLSPEQLAVRTKLVPALIESALADLGATDGVWRGVARRIGATIQKKELGDDAAFSALLLFGRAEAAALARLTQRDPEAWRSGTPEVVAAPVAASDEAEPEDDGKKAKKGKKVEAKGGSWAAYSGDQAKAIQAALESTVSLEVAVHGRMLAQNTDYSVDGALQVAHALSVHAANRDYDYTTGMDQLGLSGGAAIIDEAEMTAPLLYRYLSLDLGQLAANLRGDAEAITTDIEVAAEALIRAALFALPRGKANSMTAASAASYALIGVTQGGVACSLSEAYRRPVDANMDVAAETLENYWQAFEGRAPRAAKWWRSTVYNREPLAGVTDEPMIDALVRQVRAGVAQALTAPLPASGVQFRPLGSVRTPAGVRGAGAQYNAPNAKAEL